MAEDEIFFMPTNLNIHQKMMQSQGKKLSLCFKNSHHFFISFMKLLKINVILFLVTLGIISANAQKITLEGGYFNPKRVGPSTSETYFDAIRVGAMVEYDLKYNIGIQSGLLYNVGYSNKMQRYAVSGDSVVYTNWSHAIEIPVRVVYNLPLFKDFKIFGFAGPNFQIGLIENQTIEAGLSDALTEMTGIQSGKYELYSQEKLNRINLQIGAGGGVQWRKYIIKSGYDWGLNNLDRTKADKVRQGNWYITLSYQIK